MKNDDEARGGIVLETDPLLSAYCSTVAREHDFISHRMGWLMTLNGFLLASSTLLMVNSDKLADGSLCWAIVATSLLGIVSNSSCFFSNRWAMRAIEEAGTVLYKEWGGDLLTRAGKVQRMRLYGRDPNSFKDEVDKSPGTRWLHPWFLLPVAFALAYVSILILAMI